MRATDKIIDALSELLEGFKELQEHLKSELGSEADIDELEDAISNPELDAALVTEIRGAIEAALEGADITAEDFGEVIAAMTEALEEIDPEIFEGSADLDEDIDDLDDNDLEEIDDLDDYDDLDEFDDDDYEDDDESEDEVELGEDDDEDDMPRGRGRKRK